MIGSMPITPLDWTRNPDNPILPPVRGLCLMSYDLRESGFWTGIMVH